MKHLAYSHYGIDPDIWAHHRETADTKRVSLAVAGAIAAGDMVAIAGQRGSGKTHSLWRALDQADCQVISPLRLDREKLHIGDIQTAIVEQLSDERVRQSGERRAGQVRRLLNEATRPVLVIDEAHLLHTQTLKAIKRLRELGARGRRRQMLPVVLVGQTDPTARIAEVGLRTDAMNLAGLTSSEARAVATAVLGDAADKAAIEAICKAPAAGNWLDLKRLIDDCLIAGMNQDNPLTVDTVNNVLGTDSTEPAATASVPAGSVAQALGKGRRAA